MSDSGDDWYDNYYPDEYDYYDDDGGSSVGFGSFSDIEDMSYRSGDDGPRSPRSTYTTSCTNVSMKSEIVTARIDTPPKLSYYMNLTVGPHLFMHAVGPGSKTFSSPPISHPLDPGFKVWCKGSFRSASDNSQGGAGDDPPGTHRLRNMRKVDMSIYGSVASGKERLVKVGSGETAFEVVRYSSPEERRTKRIHTERDINVDSIGTISFRISVFDLKNEVEVEQTCSSLGSRARDVRSAKIDRYIGHNFMKLFKGSRFAKDDDTDVKLVCKASGKVYYAHQVVLKNMSDYYLKLFVSEMAQRDEDGLITIDIPQVFESAVVDTYVKVLYDGSHLRTGQTWMHRELVRILRKRPLLDLTKAVSRMLYCYVIVNMSVSGCSACELLRILHEMLCELVRILHEHLLLDLTKAVSQMLCEHVKLETLCSLMELAFTYDLKNLFDECASLYLRTSKSNGLAGKPQINREWRQLMKRRPQIAERIVRLQFPEFGGLFSAKDPQEIGKRPSKRKLVDRGTRRSKRGRPEKQPKADEIAENEAAGPSAEVNDAVAEQNGV